MKTFIIIITKYKINILINFKFKKKKILYIIIRKKIKYYNYKNFFHKNIKNNLIMIIHNCKMLYIIHSIKHFVKINHNSLVEIKINDLF